MRAATVPIVFVVLVGAVIGGLFLLRGSPEPEPHGGGPRPDSDSGLPAALAGEDGARILELRQRVRDTLGEDPEAVAALAGTLPDDAAVRVEWLRFLRPELDLALRSEHAAAGVATVAIVTRALDEPGGPVRALIEGPPFRQTWIRALSSPAPEVRIAAVRLMIDLGGDSHRARVVPALDDPTPGVRAEAVAAYAVLGGSPARLVARFRKEQDLGVRLNVLVAFASDRRMRSPDVLAIEAELLRSGPSAERIQAMSNLAAWRDQDLLAAVLDNLGAREVLVRKSALLTLQRLRDRRALERLRTYAGEEKDTELASLAGKVIADLE